jgi:hypothetical protein
VDISLIHKFNKYLISSSSMPDTAPGAVESIESNGGWREGWRDGSWRSRQITNSTQHQPGVGRTGAMERKVAGVEWPPVKGMNSWQLGLSEA